MRPLFSWLRTSAGYLWLVAVAVYLAFSAAQAVIRNYASQQETDSLQVRLDTLKQDRERLEALVVYYQTDSYKEKELRRVLLLKKPGEKVYGLPESSSGIEQHAAEEVAKAQANRNEPTWRQWVRYLLEGKEV